MNAATPAAQPFLDTSDPERVEYLYSIPDPTEALDEDFADDWARAVTRAAAAKGWLVLDEDDVAKALASPEYGAPPGLGRALAARFRPVAALTRVAEAARRRRQGRPVAAAVAYLQAWRAAAHGAYVVSDAALDAAAAALAVYAATLRGAERCFGLGGGDVDEELRITEAAPATLAAACAKAAVGATGPPALALARGARCLRTRRALLGRCVVTGALSVDDGVDLETLGEGTVRFGGTVTGADASAVALRAALLRSALALRRTEARAAAALLVCRGDRANIFKARRWKALRDDVCKRRTIHAQHLEQPHDALCRLWDDGEIVSSLRLAADALQRARLDGVSVADVQDAADAVQAETGELAAVDDALRAAFAGSGDAELEQELAELLEPPVAAVAPEAVPAPALPAFPSVGGLSLEGLSLADPVPAASVPPPAPTPVAS